MPEMRRWSRPKLAIHSPVKGSTDVSARQSEFDVIHFVGHRVLAVCELEMPHSRRGRNPDHCEKNADGAKDGLGWWEARGLLRDIQGFDGHIQCGEDAVPRLRSLEVGRHQGSREKAVWRAGCEERPDPTGYI